MKNISFMPILKAKYNNWKELERHIENLPTTKEIGDAFEQFTYAFFIIKSQQYLVDEIYMSQDIPNKYLEEYKIAHQRNSDCGIDGLIIRRDGLAMAYQCKFRSDRKKPSYEELTKFWSDSRYCDLCCTVANCYEVTDLSDKYEKNLSILAPDFDSLDIDFFNQLYEITNSSSTDVKTKKVFYEPHDYQKKIIQDVIDGFAIEDRGKIIAACGTGKTLTALWIVEKMDFDTVLFLAPSITLVKQTLESWAGQSHNSFSYLCVCSDNTVNSDLESDESDISISELGVPVTTDENAISDFLQAKSNGKKYIFCTYQSADKISNAQQLSRTTFDLIICDEAHRTAGMRSNFSLALEDKFIRSKKRLFMTATERMVRPMLLRRAQNNGQVIFSMDDETVYGPLFSRYNFGDAIKDKTISDYKIVVAGVKESEVYNYIANNTQLKLTDLDNEEKIITAEQLYAKLMLSKTMHEFPIHKVISFHSSIKRSSDFVSNNDDVVTLKNIVKQYNNHIEDDELYVNNISCKVPASKRAEIMSTFKDSEYGIISNAKCLTEGVDVPIIDSVYFVDQKKSLVDIVQACGRALRTKKGSSKTAYFIIPILIPESEVASDILYSEKFDAVYNIIQALRDQDSRLEDWINELNRKYVQGGQGGVAGTDRDEDGTGDFNPVTIDIEGIDLDQFSEELFVKIATVNATHASQQMYGAGARTAGQTRLFKPMVDMKLSTLMDNLVIPTMNSYKIAKSRQLASDVIRFNHNNISHTVKVGLIQKEGSATYGLTPLGDEFIQGKYNNELLLKRQLLRYSCSVEDSNIIRILFPYRACLEVLKGLPGKKKISFIEFAFCIYTMQDSTKVSIIKAIQGIQYLRVNYPNIDQVNQANRATILNELNSYFGSTLSEGDVWGARATTVKNQYMYFRDHLSIYKEAIEIKNREIYMKRGSEQVIDRLLAPDKALESLPRKSLLAKYSEALMIILLFSV